jgi:hypothetical protein
VTWRSRTGGSGVGEDLAVGGLGWSVAGAVSGVAMDGHTAGADRPVGMRAERMNQREIPEFRSGVAVLPLSCLEGRAWQAVRVAEKQAVAARPPRKWV